jgi:hypothetical protein
VTGSGRGIFLDAVISSPGKAEINNNQIQGVDYKLHQLMEAFVTAHCIV